MAEQPNDTRALMLMGLLALWLAVFGYSLMPLLSATNFGVSTGPGLGPMPRFFGWQGVAGMVAFACWGIGWSFPRGTGIRRISAIPLGMALALILVVMGMAVFGG